MFAKVLIEYPTKKIDKYFTYKIPIELISLVKRGMKVQIPFGTKVINGFVMEVTDTYEDDYELKEIVYIVDQELILSEELMSLGLYIQEKTLCPLIMAYQTMLPSSLKIKNQTTNYIKYKTYLVLNKSKEEIQNYLVTYKKVNYQTELLNDLLIKEKILKSNYGRAVVKALEDKELIKEVKEQEYRINKDKKTNLLRHKLNTEQLKAYETIKNTNKNATFLLEGIFRCSFIFLISSSCMSNNSSLRGSPIIFTLSDGILKIRE